MCGRIFSVLSEDVIFVVAAVVNIAIFIAVFVAVVTDIVALLVDGREGALHCEFHDVFGMSVKPIPFLGCQVRVEGVVGLLSFYGQK